MTFEVRPYDESDLQKIRLKEMFSGEGVDQDKLVLRSPAWTVNSGSVVLAIFGASIRWPGVAELWGLTSDDMGRLGPSLTKGLRKYLEDGARSLNIHRVSFTVKADYEQGLRWARVLGFTQEAVLRQYGIDKSDYVLMARLF